MNSASAQIIQLLLVCSHRACNGRYAAATQVHDGRESGKSGIGRPDTALRLDLPGVLARDSLIAAASRPKGLGNAWMPPRIESAIQERLCKR